MKKETREYIANLMWYFIIFSVIGLIVETLFGFLTMGILESRKGLVIGPFCPIYGCGAVLIIAALNRFKDSKLKIFFYGMIAGAAVEYVISFILEEIYGTRFWDYSYLPYNLNGRICVRYSSYWGILSLLMIYLVKPKVDKLINKIPKKEIIAEAALIFFIIDALLTVIAINSYQARARAIYNDCEIKKEDTVIMKVFPDKFMEKTFPNIRLKTDDGKLIFIRDIIEKGKF